MGVFGGKESGYGRQRHGILSGVLVLCIAATASTRGGENPRQATNSAGLGLTQRSATPSMLRSLEDRGDGTWESLDGAETPNVMTLNLRPTSSVLFFGRSQEGEQGAEPRSDPARDSDQRRLFSAESEERQILLHSLIHAEGFDHYPSRTQPLGSSASSSVYAFLEEIDHQPPKWTTPQQHAELLEQHNRFVRDFNRRRHYSRYEWRWRRRQRKRNRRRLHRRRQRQRHLQQAQSQQPLPPLLPENQIMAEQQQQITTQPQIQQPPTTSQQQMDQQQPESPPQPTPEQLRQQQKQQQQQQAAEQQLLPQQPSSQALGTIDSNPLQQVEDDEQRRSPHHDNGHLQQTPNQPLPTSTEVPPNLQESLASQQDQLQEEHRHHKSGGLLNSYQTAPLSQGYGTHFATVWVGSPQPQRKSVIVDTGSHYTAFPCAGCHNCGEEHHTDAYFDPSQSTTFRPVQCTDCRAGAKCSTDGSDRCVFSQSYTEGSSWEAYQAIDRFFCGGRDAPSAGSNPVDASFAINFMFGCQTSQTGLFVTQLADGIMGMSAHEASLSKQMFNEGKLEHNLFTLCFRRELSVSKHGVAAGIMTLGGIDTRLDSSPMVFARNMALTGWYTVQVKNVFLRKGGGQSAKTDQRANHEVMKIPVDIQLLNSGKGVIVDSGTTDTYLHKHIAESFGEVWRTVTGREYSNSAVKLSREEVFRLPTVLLQLRAFDPTPDPTWNSADSVTGLVGSLDPSSPHDVLLAIPATHYMEYSPSKDVYTSRLYFTESRGGVLGANAMQSHDVLFDWENSRVGIAESTCDYVGIESEAAESSASDHANDCVLGVPHLTKACHETVMASACENTHTDTVTGREEWTMLVLSPATSAGRSCEAVGMQGEEVDKSRVVVKCDGNGVCTKTITCQLTCVAAKAALAAAASLRPVEPSPDLTSFRCGENIWSACQSSCNQTRIVSATMSDGMCHELRPQREKRRCHIDACGRSDPCRVPFVVHAIFGFRGAVAHRFNRYEEELFAEAFASAVNRNKGPDDELFEAGDIKVLIAKVWHEGDDEGRPDDGRDVERGAEIGMKLVVELSIYNPHVHFSDGVDSNPLGERSKKGVAATSRRAQFSTCGEADVYPLALTAQNVNVELGRGNFMGILMESLGLKVQNNPESPFAQMLQSKELMAASTLLKSWTIKTEIRSDLAHDPKVLSPISRLGVEYFLYSSTHFTILSASIVGVIVIACACGTTYQRSRERASRSNSDNDSDARGASRRSKRPNDRGSRGKYSLVPTREGSRGGRRGFLSSRLSRRDPQAQAFVSEDIA